MELLIKFYKVRIVDFSRTVLTRIVIKIGSNKPINMVILDFLFESILVYESYAFIFCSTLTLMLLHKKKWLDAIC